MSLINQVLLDLDGRFAGEAPLHTSARSVAAMPRGRLALRTAGVLLAIGAGVGIAMAATLVLPAMQTAPTAEVVVASRSPRTSAPIPLPVTVPVPATLPMTLPEVTVSAPPAAPELAAEVTSTQPRDATQMLALAGSDDHAFVLSTLARGTAAAPSEAESVSTRSGGSSRDGVSTSTVASLSPSAAIDPKLESSVEKRALPWAPHDRAEAEYRRALALHQQGQVPEAKLAFANALKEDSLHSPARQALAVALVGEGRLDEVQALLAEGLALNPRDAQLAATLARVKAEQQDLSGAIAVLLAALPASPMTSAKNESPEPRALLATLQQKAGQNAAAVDNFSAALKLAPNNGAWWIGLAISLAADGRADSARTAFERARGTDSLSPELARYVDQRLANNRP
jgi:MSHA biogenesis protein MshN